MTKDELIADFYKRYEELKTALRSADIDRIRELSLEVHAMVHPAEVSGRADKTLADYAIPMPIGEPAALCSPIGMKVS